MKSFPVAATGALIDLDGTLLDTAPDIAEAVNAMLVERGREPLPLSRVAQFVGKGSEVLVHRALTDDPQGRAEPRDHAAALERFLHHYARTNGTRAVRYPGVLEGLTALREAGLRLACVTNKPQAFADALLESTGLARFFAFTQGGDALPFKKPDPRPLLQAAARLGCAPAGTVAIGDSVNDALAARAAGMTVFVVPYGYNEGVEVQSLDVDAIVDSIAHAAGMVRLARPPGP